MALAHDVVLAEGARPERSFVLLHGILGSGPNLRTIARRFVAERPRWAAVLVDLRRHGGSLDAPGPDTLAQAALDVAALAGQLEQPAHAVLGHSFGGKVALQWLATAGEGIEDAFVVDSNPGPRPDARGSEDTLRVIDVLEGLPYPFASREDFVSAFLAGVLAPEGPDGSARSARTGGPGVREPIDLVARDPRRPIAQWLAMSLRRGDDGWRFGPPLASIRALLASYFATDLWPVVESPPEGARVHLVIGDRSPVLDADDRERAARVAARIPERVTVDVLPTSHWVHVEDPDGLLRAILGRTPA